MSREITGFLLRLLTWAGGASLAVRKCCKTTRLRRDEVSSLRHIELEGTLRHPKRDVK